MTAEIALTFDALSERPANVAARSRPRVYREEDACVQQTQWHYAGVQD
jgi:hypothetical protein